jgi:hypothetical protein
MKISGHVPRLEKIRNAYTISNKALEGTKRLERSGQYRKIRNSWHVSMRIAFIWFRTGSSDEWKHGNQSSNSMVYGIFLDQLSHCQILLVIRLFENIYTWTYFIKTATMRWKHANIITIQYHSPVCVTRTHYLHMGDQSVGITNEPQRVIGFNKNCLYAGQGA